MLQFQTYPQERTESHGETTDWSAEVQRPMEPSDTGLGGIRRETERPLAPMERWEGDPDWIEQETQSGGPMGTRMQERMRLPANTQQAYQGSLKAMLSRNIGNYVVATFLIGTQGTVSWEGILYDVGNDFLTIYQTGRDRYIVIDIYSLKYVEFYDTRRRELCDRLLGQNGGIN